MTRNLAGAEAGRKLPEIDLLAAIVPRVLAQSGPASSVATPPARGVGAGHILSSVRVLGSVVLIGMSVVLVAWAITTTESEGDNA